MAAQLTWLIYAGTSYIAWSFDFRLRYGRWPTAYRLPPRNFAHGAYMAGDLALNLALVSYTAWLILGPAPQATLPGIGLAFVAIGAGLRLWTVVTLGPNWRMGQDDDDHEAAFVASGPYRFLNHPINAALVTVALGQAFLTSFDGRAWLLMITAVAYYFAQAQAEQRFWSTRTAPSPDPAQSPEIRH